MNKNTSLKESFRHAAEGFMFALKRERNMKVHFCFTIAVIVCAVLFGLTGAEKAVVLALCGLVIAAELFNTAIENVVDLVSPTFNMYAKRAKDISAAAVLTVSIGAAICGLIIFVPYGIKLLQYIMMYIQRII